MLRDCDWCIVRELFLPNDAWCGEGAHLRVLRRPSVNKGSGQAHQKGHGKSSAVCESPCVAQMLKEESWRFNSAASDRPRHPRGRIAFAKISKSGNKNTAGEKISQTHFVSKILAESIKDGRVNPDSTIGW